MSIIDWNIIEGESITVTREGWAATKKVLVTRVSNLYPGYQKIYSAWEDLGLVIGEQHPILTNAFLQTVTVQAIACDSFEFNLDYQPMLNVPPEVTITSSPLSVQSNKDIEGDAIKVSYTYPASYAADPLKAGETLSAGKIVDKNILTSNINVKKREVITGLALSDKVQTYQNTTNLASWNMRPDDAAGLWMCESIGGVWIGGVIVDDEYYSVYDVTYNFVYQAGGWTTEVIFIDPTTGEPPDPTTYGADTWKEIALYSSSDFTALTGDI